MNETKTLALLPLLAAALVAACGDDDAPPTGCDGVRVERFRELVVVDDAVTSGDRARNATRGPFGFARAMTALGGSDAGGRALARQLVDAWAAASPTPRVRAELTCAWLRRSGANECDDGCGRCAREELDLARAPFRLAAIANRVDLGAHPDALSEAGEGRLVFAVVDGDGDDPAAPSLEATVIFEYALPGGRREWAERFHTLSRFTSFGDDYQAALAAVTERFVSAPRLAQIRINDGAFDPTPRLYELALRDGDLAPRALRNTPKASLDGSQELAAWIRAHDAEVRADRHVVPTAMRASSVERGRVVSVDVPEDLRVAFARGTCNGCHGEAAPTLGGFHVAPRGRGADRLSRFVHDPAAPRRDDLARREAFVSGVLCAP